MKFEVLTLVPIDLDALLPEQMTFEEREQLNNYHQLVYKRSVLICLKQKKNG